MRFNRGRVVPVSQALRARRRRRARMTGALAFLVVCMVVGAFVYALRAPSLRLTNISVLGADAVSNDQIASFVKSELSGNYYFFIPRNNIVFYQGSDLAAAVSQAFPTLAGVKTNLNSLSSVSITVLLRLPKALWCGSDPASPSSCLVMDQNGTAYEPAPTSTGIAYVSYYGALDTSHTPPQFLSPAVFQSLAALIDALAGKAGAGPAVSAAVDSYGNVHVQFQNGFTVFFTLDDAQNDSGALLQRFSLVLMSPALKGVPSADFEYLDMRFGDKIYYKLKSGEVASTSAAE